MLYMKKKYKNSTIRIKELTKNKLKNLSFVKKDMSYESIIDELIKRGK